MRINRRSFLLGSTGLGAALFSAGPSNAAAWSDIEKAARGQKVFFSAWAGSDTINAYIAWAGQQLAERYGVTLEHVKITDTAEVVRRVRDEVKANVTAGSVDLLWINGENSRAMKMDQLLFGPFATMLPNFQYVDIDGKPTTLIDFAEPTDGLESPWGMAQLTFFGDGAKISAPPLSIAQLIDFAKANPGRVTYPAPPDFHGTTFVKQVLIETIGTPEVLQLEVSKEAFTKLAAPLWLTLDAMHPLLWREGKQFPPNQAQMKQMLGDGELLISFSFNPNEPANLVASGELPKSTIAWQHTSGTIGNTHFVAIPINAQAKEAAQVAANFLLSPEAQARKADLKIWGDPTVLAISRLSASDAALFGTGKVDGGVIDPGPALSEPHASWVPLIEAAWLERYGK